MGDISVAVLIIAALAFALGALIQGSIGFGSNLIAAPILFLIEPSLVPGPLLTAGMIMAALFASRERGHGSWREVGVVILGRIPGSALGALALVALAARPLGILIGVLLLVAVGLSLTRWDLEPTTRTLFGAGVISGVTATVVAVGGPPVAVVYQRSTGPDVRANMARVLLIGTAASLAAVAFGGSFGMTEALYGLALVPPGLVGYLASRYTAGILDQGRTRAAVLTVCAAAAVAIIIRSAL